MLADRIRMGSIGSIELGPGPSELIAGTMNAGFFGEVPASELFTASELPALYLNMMPENVIPEWRQPTGGNESH